MMNSMPTRKKPKPPSTLVEVARAAGVSVATVSRILNGENKELWPGPAARAQRIRQIASKMGYRPDWRARALRGGQTHSIGVVYSQTNPMMDMTSYGRMFRTFGEVLEPAGYHLMFVHVPRQAGPQPTSILQAVDAAVYYHQITEGALDASGLVRGPSILINCEPRLPFPTVYPDDTGGAKALIHHLLSLGHKRIVFVAICRPGSDYDHYSLTVRQQAIREVMDEAGLAANLMVWQADYGVPYGEMVSRYKTTKAAERPTAMVVSYSVPALLLLNEFVRQNVRIPEELSIATFDDHELLERAIVPMTTVAVPMEEMGRTSAGLILGLLQNPNKKAVGNIVLSERLIARASTGLAPD